MRPCPDMEPSRERDGEACNMLVSTRAHGGEACLMLEFIVRLKQSHYENNSHSYQKLQFQ